MDIEVGFTLTGPLAQFSRSNLLRDIARRMTESFARNLQSRLSGGNGRAGAERTARSDASELDAGSLILPVLWERIKAFFRSLLGR